MLCSQILRSCSRAAATASRLRPIPNICRYSSRLLSRPPPAAPHSRVHASRDATSSLDADNIPVGADVTFDKKDLTLKELLDMVAEDELDLQPQYQRGLVWNLQMASRLVVTALENRIVPTVYLEEAADGRYMIMDGKQRLTSLLTFISGKKSIGNITWDNAPVQLDVKEDSCDMRWQGKRFIDLPKDRQRKLLRYSLLCVIVSSKTDRDVVFSIYQDINTGAVGHTDQQNRKAAYHGSYINLLEELAGNSNFLKIQDREAPDSEKEFDRELVLRYFAMLRSANSFKTPLWRFLNQELKDYQHASEAEMDRLRQLFKQTTDTVWQIFGLQACRLPKADTPAAGVAASKAKKASELHPSLWDATMVAVSQELEFSSKRRKELVQAADAICQAYKELCSSKDFKASLENRSKKNVLQRVAMFRRMLQQAAPTRDDRRAFSQTIKLQLWGPIGRAQSVRACALCQQTIHCIEDAEVDHIQPWSHGGLTTLDNAQLVHRFCNRSKGNRIAGDAQSSQPNQQAGQGGSSSSSNSVAPTSSSSSSMLPVIGS